MYLPKLFLGVCYKTDLTEQAFYIDEYFVFNGAIRGTSQRECSPRQTFDKNCCRLKTSEGICQEGHGGCTNHGQCEDVENWGKGRCLGGEGRKDSPNDCSRFTYNSTTTPFTVYAKCCQVGK